MTQTSVLIKAMSHHFIKTVPLIPIIPKLVATAATTLQSKLVATAATTLDPMTSAKLVTLAATTNPDFKLVATAATTFYVALSKLNATALLHVAPLLPNSHRYGLIEGEFTNSVCRKEYAEVCSVQPVEGSQHLYGTTGKASSHRCLSWQL